MDLKLSGRTALITGSSKGIGLSVAQWFARDIRKGLRVLNRELGGCLTH